jgi:hypothetical protein
MADWFLNSFGQLPGNNDHDGLRRRIFVNSRSDDDGAAMDDACRAAAPHCHNVRGVSTFHRHAWISTELSGGVSSVSVLPSRYPGSAASFAVYSIALGFSYAHSARRTGSIRWCTISHCIHDALGLGASAYAGWLT